MSQELELGKRKRILLLPTGGAERTEVPIIQGPLGIWNFPLLNALLQFLYAVRGGTTPLPHAYFPRTASRRTEYIRDPTSGRIMEKYEEIEVY